MLNKRFENQMDRLKIVNQDILEVDVTEYIATEEEQQQESRGEEPCNEEPEEIDGCRCVEAEDMLDAEKDGQTDKEA